MLRVSNSRATSWMRRSLADETTCALRCTRPPGLTTSLVSSQGLGSWFPLLLVAAYNTGDLIGKSAPSVARMITRPMLPVCAMLHCLFIPALLLLSHPQYLPVAAMRTDMFAAAVIFKLGVSTGYLGEKAAAQLREAVARTRSPCMLASVLALTLASCSQCLRFATRPFVAQAACRWCLALSERRHLRRRRARVSSHRLR